MEPLSIYQKRYHIGFRDVDFTKQLKLSALFGYFQDIASEHAENLGFGIEKLMQQFGVTWVLLKIKVEILRNPIRNEEIVVETWPQAPKRIEFERDYIVRDQQDNVIVRATTIWGIIDINTRELRKTEIIGVNYPPIKEERACDSRPGKIKAVGVLEEAYKKVIGYSDIDINGHLNNTKYIDFLMDCFSIKSHEKYGVKSIEVAYVNEALSGDTISLLKDISALDSKNIYIEGVNVAKNKVVFRSQLELYSKD